MSSRRVAFVVAFLALAVSGCISNPFSNGLGGDAPEYRITTNPPGARILVKDCPSCPAMVLGTAPYTGPGPKGGLKGKLVTAALTDYETAEPVKIRGGDAKELHFDLKSSAKGRKTATTAKAATAATAAIGGRVVGKGRYLLCSLIDRYPMCDGRPCRKDGLTATSYFVCRENTCAGKEVPTESTATYRSFSSCVASCRKVESQKRAKRITSETAYCTH